MYQIEYHTCCREYPSFPLVDNEHDTFIYPATTSDHILTLSSKSAKGHAKNLSVELAKLFQHMDIDHLIFLGDQQRAWRCQDNPYPPVQEALLFLKANKVTKKFDGALDIPRGEWAVFFKHLFWLVRCNAALPIIHFMDGQQSVLGSICQYGNLHLSILAPGYESRFLLAKEKTAFEELQEKTCYATFSRSSKIANRQAMR